MGKMIHELWGVADSAGAEGIVDDDDSPMDSQMPGFSRRVSQDPIRETQGFRSTEHSPPIIDVKRFDSRR